MGKTAVISSAASAPTFWFLGIAWTTLVDGRDNGGRFSLMEQLMPRGSGPPRIHQFNDEMFYVLDGSMQMRLGAEEIDAVQSSFHVEPSTASR